MEESCVARVVSPGRFTSIGDEEAQVNVRRKDKKKTIWRFQGSCSPATASCILWRHITHTGSSSLFSYYVHFAWWNMGSPHILFGLLCPPPDGHTAALFSWTYYIFAGDDTLACNRLFLFFLCFCCLPALISIHLLAVSCLLSLLSRFSGW